MNYSIFAFGFTMALIAVMVVLLIRLWAKTNLQSWGYDLTRETHSQLRDTHFKLDAIQREQQRLLSRLDSLDRASDKQLSKLSELSAHLSSPKSAA
jgi:hypothetical protein